MRVKTHSSNYLWHLTSNAKLSTTCTSKLTWKKLNEAENSRQFSFFRKNWSPDTITPKMTGLSFTSLLSWSCVQVKKVRTLSLERRLIGKVQRKKVGKLYWRKYKSWCLRMWCYSRTDWKNYSDRHLHTKCISVSSTMCTRISTLCLKIMSALSKCFQLSALQF